ncbi:MAG: membrane-bound lytic murein transglycosylase MltF [Gammaproteobacteria bacterium]|nr:membrane-bound lytic murein transglycosylase MltF [Gammaproteobacteria bacterium]
MRWGLIICCSVFMATCAQPPSLLDEIVSLGELRVITRNSPTTFYTGSNGPEGPEYDLVMGFANFIGVQLKLKTADRFSDLLAAVESGRSHIAAAGLTITPERAARVDFGPSYHDVRQYLIYKLGTGRPRTVEDLLGKKLEVVSGTSYVETLENIQSLHPELVWTENPHADLAELLARVSSQEIDYTIADSSLFKVYRNYVPEIRIGFELTMGDSLAWAFPKRHDRSLMERAEQYVEFIRKNGDLDRVKDRYYGHTKQFDYVGTRRFIRDYNSILPRYRHIFERAAKNQKVDWRLLAAIGYQESHWDPMAISPTGVRGIMMLTKNTANVLGIEDRVDPTQSIQGGAQYLKKIKARLPATIKEPDRTWFALASYNVGYGHVQDARIITEQLGKEMDLWAHVKNNLPLLTQHNWYSKTKHGYARGWEPVMYVENIRNYYDILIWLTEDDGSEPDIDAPTVAMHGEKNRQNVPFLF